MKTLRPYQQKAHDALNDHLTKDGKSGILSLATGGGKTFTAAKWAYDRFLSCGEPVFWVSHRDTLDQQAYEAFYEIDPTLDIQRWSASEKKISNTGLTLIQIFSARNFPKSGQAPLIVLDESHHERAKSWTDFLKHRDPEYKLGLTACTDRLDGKIIDFEKVVYSKSLFELMQEGYAPKANVYMFKTEQHYSMARNKSDFTNASLSQLDNPTRNKLIVDEYLRNSYGKTIVFACNTEHAYELEKCFKQKNINAIALTSKDSKELRDKEVLKVKANHYDVVINVGLYTEGFDWPECQTVFLVRPTMSKNLYLQMVGRGARLSPGSVSIHDSAKKTFNAVHFIDDIHQYAYVAENWAVDHLGLKSKAVSARRAIEDQEKTIKDALKEVGLTPGNAKVKKVTGLERKLIEIAGVGLYSSKFFCNRKLVMTANDLYGIDLFQEYIKRFPSGDKYKAVNDSYGVFADTVDLEASEWKSLCWANYFKNVKNQDSIKCESGRQSGKIGKTFDIKRFTDPPSENEIQQDVDKFLEERDQFNERIYPKAEQIVQNAISNLCSDGYARKCLQGKLFYKDYSNKNFELEYEGDISQFYYWKDIVKDEISKLSDGEIGITVKIKEIKTLDLPPSNDNDLFSLL